MALQVVSRKEASSSYLEDPSQVSSAVSSYPSHISPEALISIFDLVNKVIEVAKENISSMDPLNNDRTLTCCSLIKLLNLENKASRNRLKVVYTSLSFFHVFIHSELKIAASQYFFNKKKSKWDFFYKKSIHKIEHAEELLKKFAKAQSSSQKASIVYHALKEFKQDDTTIVRVTKASTTLLKTLTKTSAKNAPQADDTLPPKLAKQVHLDGENSPAPSQAPSVAVSYPSHIPPETLIPIFDLVNKMIEVAKKNLPSMRSTLDHSFTHSSKYKFTCFSLIKFLNIETRSSRHKLRAVYSRLFFFHLFIYSELRIAAFQCFFNIEKSKQDLFYKKSLLKIDHAQDLLKQFAEAQDIPAKACVVYHAFKESKQNDDTIVKVANESKALLKILSEENVSPQIQEHTRTPTQTPTDFESLLGCLNPVLDPALLSDPLSSLLPGSPSHQDNSLYPTPFQASTVSESVLGDLNLALDSLPTLPSSFLESLPDPHDFFSQGADTEVLLS